MASHLTLEERDRIAQLRHRGADQKEIPKALGRSAGTIRQGEKITFTNWCWRFWRKMR